MDDANAVTTKKQTWAKTGERVEPKIKRIRFNTEEPKALKKIRRNIEEEATEEKETKRKEKRRLSAQAQRRKVKDPKFIPWTYNKIPKNLKMHLTPDDFRQKDQVFEGLNNTNKSAWGQIHMTIAGSSHVTSLSLGETVMDLSLLVNSTLHTNVPPTVNPHDSTMGKPTKESEDTNAEVNPHRLELPSTPPAPTMWNPSTQVEIYSYRNLPPTPSPVSTIPETEEHVKGFSANVKSQEHLSELEKLVVPQQVEQTVEEKFTLWEGRLKGFVASVKAHEHLSELEKEIDAVQDIITTAYFKTLPEGTRALLTVQIMELFNKRDAVKEECDRHIESLVRSGYWPLQPPPFSLDPDHLQQDHEEIVDDVKDLRETANEVKAILREITELKLPPKYFLSHSFDEELGADNTMDVEEKNQRVASSSSKAWIKNSTLPSRMKRKIFQRQHQVEVAEEQIPTQTELDDVLNLLWRLETIVDTLWADTIEHDHEMIEDFKERLTSKVEDLKTEWMEELQSRDEKRRSHEAATAARINSMKEEVGVTVGELAVEIGDMMLKVDNLQAELEKQRGERAESWKRVHEAQSKLEEFRVNEKNSDKIEILKSAVEAYTTDWASPLPMPTVLPPASILRALEDSLIPVMRMSVQPLIDELRDDMEKLINTKNGDLYSFVWDKIS